MENLRQPGVCDESPPNEDERDILTAFSRNCDSSFLASQVAPGFGLPAMSQLERQIIWQATDNR
jgi:hypothetical protein